MKEIWYEEFAPDRGYQKLQEALFETPYSFQKEIASYLRKGNVILTGLSRAKDVFTGERIPDEVHIMTDGEYLWPNELAWYVEKYNLRLPKDFEEHILKKLEIH